MAACLDYNIYQSIIDDVMSKIADNFVEHNVDLSVMKELEELWKANLEKTKSIQPERINTLSGKERRQSFVAFPKFTSKSPSLTPPSTSSPSLKPSVVSSLLNFRVQDQKIQTKVQSPDAISHQRLLSVRSKEVHKKAPTIRQVDGATDFMSSDEEEDEDDEEEDDKENKDKKAEEEQELIEEETADDDIEHPVDDIDAPTLDDIRQMFECNNVLNCSFKKMEKKKHSIDTILTKGVLSLDGKEFVLRSIIGSIQLEK